MSDRIFAGNNTKDLHLVAKGYSLSSPTLKPLCDSKCDVETQVHQTVFQVDSAVTVASSMTLRIKCGLIDFFRFCYCCYCTKDCTIFLRKINFKRGQSCGSDKIITVCHSVLGYYIHSKISLFLR